MIFKNQLISASSAAAKSIGNGNQNHLILFTSSTAIIGDLLSDGDHVESSPVYSALFEGFTSSSKLFDETIDKFGKSNSYDSTSKRQIISRMRGQKDSIVYLQNVTIQSLSSLQPLNVDFLAVDLDKITSFTIGSSSMQDSQ